MKKFLILSFCQLSTLLASVQPLPEQFHVVERLLSLTSTFDISSDLKPLATAHKRFFSLTSTFDLVDADLMPIATANTRFFSWGTALDIIDPEGAKIGWIEEELLRILPWAEYRVFNASNQMVAIAKMNFWGTTFELFHPDHRDELYATISRPYFRCFRDYWVVNIINRQIFDTGVVDPRILMLLAICQTDKDNRDQYRREISDQLKAELEYHEGNRFK